MTTVYAVHNGTGWVSRQVGIEFKLTPRCLWSKAPVHEEGTIYQFELVKRYQWENEPELHLPNLELDNAGTIPE